MAPRDDGVNMSEAPNGFKVTGYNKMPTNYPHRTFEEWLKGKRIDDALGPYWRVHDKLYDLTDFVDKHPGGRAWLQLTKGTDITEAFETAHIFEGPEELLQKYYVKDIETPRNSVFTFHDDGFYRTLKRKVRPILKEIGTGTSWSTMVIQDSLALAFVFMAYAATVYSSYALAIAAGAFLAFTTICAHNYFHQRDNWRMYYYDLSPLPSHEWRVTHALSHHLYTNTVADYEISALEPMWAFLPRPDKAFLQRYGIIYDVFAMGLFPLIGIVKRTIEMLTGATPPRPEYFLVFVELLLMTLTSSSFYVAFKLFSTMHITFGIVFLGIGTTVAHHHPDIFHDGDKLRDDPDWGLCQLDAVRDRNEVTGNLLMVLLTFGDHTLHHLLPTVDHSKLNALYPAFMDTCKQFNIPFSFETWPTLAIGKYMQMANITPNTNPPGYKTKAA